eukprot:gnl/Spiro4/26748_TR13285_c0_g1_i1.p1 gnl/Spiro4/26748_TR13285_c0_g1~~gnl/Spiro4/26748_TR13285_c0_g1_i1.p1  ORF type:complete len:474 (+),score=68.21 gnl/Spiro4/26748_TR13285_c0_g1_i1:58-1479(+)
MQVPGGWIDPRAYPMYTAGYPPFALDPNSFVPFPTHEDPPMDFDFLSLSLVGHGGIDPRAHSAISENAFRDMCTSLTESSVGHPPANVQTPYGTLISAHVATHTVDGPAAAAAVVSAPLVNATSIVNFGSAVVDSVGFGPGVSATPAVASPVTPVAPPPANCWGKSKSWAEVARLPPVPLPQPPQVPVNTPQAQQSGASQGTQNGQGTNSKQTGQQNGHRAPKNTKQAQPAPKPRSRPQQQPAEHGLQLGDVNPAILRTTPPSNSPHARFFVIKSYSEDDVHKAIKYGVWASTESGNRRLDVAFRESSENGPIFLFFSVNASGRFCGMAQMTSALDYNTSCEFWDDDRWGGRFSVRWHYIKDIPNNQFRHITNPKNDDRPVTNSRDTQEVPLEQGRAMLSVFANFRSAGSILDDFTIYDDKQILLQQKKAQQAAAAAASSSTVRTSTATMTSTTASSSTSVSSGTAAGPRRNA